MRRIRTSLRTGALAIAVGALVTGALLAAPAGQAVPPASSQALAGVLQALDRSARLAGTAWGIDPAAGRVVVWLDQTVTGAKLARLTAAVSGFGSAVRLERVAGTLAPRVQGGDTVYTMVGKCTVGFNARNSSNVYYFVSAGHCAWGGGTVYTNAAHTTVLGTVVASSFPGNDYAIVKYTNSAVSHPGTVNLYNGTSQDIVSAAAAYVGEPVRRVGSTTGVHSGTVTAVNVTVNYAEGTVTGLIKTNLCSEAGDSGGPVFDGTKAIGTVSGGSGNCSTGGITYVQPVTEPLAAYGLTVY